MRMGACNSEFLNAIALVTQAESDGSQTAATSNPEFGLRIFAAGL